MRGNVYSTAGRDDDRAELATGQASDVDMARDLVGRGFPVALIQRADLGFVREHNIDPRLDELEPPIAMAIDAERVTQGQSGLCARCLADIHRLSDGLFGDVDIPQVALAVDEPCRCHQLLVDIVR